MRNKTKLTALCVAITIGLSMFFFPPKEIWAWIAANYWRVQLDAAPDDNVQLIVDKIANLDKAGIPKLANALGADRECISWAAKQELLRKLDYWQVLSNTEINLRLKIMAEALAKEVDNFRSSARTDAADLAAKILLLLRKGRGADVEESLCAVEKVIRADHFMREDHFVEETKQAADSLLNSTISALQEHNGKNGSDAPLKPSSIKGQIQAANPVAREKKEPAETSDSRFKQPRILDPLILSKKVAIHQLPKASRIPDGVEQTTEPGAREKNNSHQTPVSNRICSINQIGSVVSDEQAISQLVEKDVVDLLRAINGGNQTSGKAAEAELIRHGFTEAQIALCCHMLDPDPQVRKRLVQVLPGLPNVDATAWLLRLCHDSDAEVRLAAMQFLATSSNPLVLNELEQIARRDPDAAIQRLADRLATGQKKSR